MVGLGAALIGGGFSIAGGLFGASAAKKRQKEAAREKRRLQNKLNTLEDNRQASNRGGWPMASSHFVRFIPPYC